MSDRRYSMIAVLTIGAEPRTGCAYYRPDTQPPP
jgi:uncharacterized membrane protein